MQVNFRLKFVSAGRFVKNLKIGDLRLASSFVQKNSLIGEMLSKKKIYEIPI